MTDHQAHGTVVVGVDQRSESQGALNWAAAEAARRGAELRVVHAWEAPMIASPVGVTTIESDLSQCAAAAERRLEWAIGAIPEEIRNQIPQVSPACVQDGPSPALLEASEGADLLVVGTRGRGPITGLLGSVSHQCVHHATCPIVVVPPGWPVGPPTRIVVGVDGSDCSADALRWAFEEAARWDAQVAVVHLWNIPYPVEPWGLVATPLDQEAFKASAETLIDRMINACVAAGAPRPSSLTSIVLEETAGQGLVRASREADLLVVGSRGRGGFKALLLGSTSLNCVATSTCPVAIIRPTPPST